MKILVIGGSRFVGPLAIKKLLHRGHVLTVFNRGRISQEYPREVSFIKGDRNGGFPFQERFDAVIDICAYRGEQTRRALQELQFDFFVHMSTAAVYKKTEIFPLTEESPLGVWPLWGEYGKEKVECEMVLQESGVLYASLRPVYILGPHNYCNRENFIYGRIQRGAPLILPGDGQALIQFAFAEDVANTLVLLAEKQIPGAYNCAGKEATTLRGLVAEMGDIVGKKPVVAYDQKNGSAGFNVSEFPFANEHVVVENEKIKNMGAVFTPLRAGLKRDYENYYCHVS